ncbi:condensation domain-containing protein [Gordonia sp. i37]|uniref:condensation domain-containing protein n=1 Tax=Gordonia sp. i37 TaxID=1961707 RepID=UPI0009AC9E67|nr:condensation domain-containing protein [Gordonia sp. i37]OPX15749.1 acyltransferase [Gordonia sp. i37]
MVSFGLIDEWEPRIGRLTSWTMSQTAVTAAAGAPIHPVPPSHQQEAYLRAAQRNQSAGFRFSRLCLQAFDFHSPLDADALTRTIDAFLRRHDTFRCWFSEEPDGSIARHVVDPAIISMTPTTHGDMDSASAIREHIQNETPGPFSWDCFTFGAIEWEGGFTLYGAIDHLDTDGISQALTCTELITLYMNKAFGLDTGLPEVGSYIEYCDHERTVSAALTRQAPQVCRWVELLQANGGVLPGFPLPLGGESEDHTRSALLTMSVFSEDDAQRFEDVCRANDSNMTAGLMAVAALASYEFSGCTEYLGMTPKSTRAPGPALNSVGWFTSLIPVPITVGADATFTSIVGPAAESYAAGKELTDVSLHRVLELVEPDDGIDVAPGWSVPMVSYVDVRKLPGVDVFDAINGCLYGNRGSSEEGFMWINRFRDQTSMTLLFPDTDEAHAALPRYTDALRTIMATIARSGDYRPTVLALT